MILKKISFSLTLLVSCSFLFGQVKLDNKWKVNTGVGVAYSGTENFGYSMDMNVSRRLYKKIDVGVFFNIMNTQAIANDLAQGFDGVILLFGAQDIENLENLDFWHSYQRKNYYSTGLQLSYKIVDTRSFHLSLGGGYYYSIYSRSFNQISDGGPAGLANIGYSYFNAEDWRYHFVYEFGYKINEIVTVGLKGRYLSIQDELGTYAYIGVSF